MTFAKTYAEEVIQSRRIRSQRAGFWAKIIGFTLMVTVAAVLHLEPRLRSAIMSAAVNGVTTLSGDNLHFASADAAQPQGNGGMTVDAEALRAAMRSLQPGRIGGVPGMSMPTGNTADQAAIEQGALPDRVKVNRHGFGAGSGAKFQKAPEVISARQVLPADPETGKMSRLLRDMRAGL